MYALKHDIFPDSNLKRKKLGVQAYELIYKGDQHFERGELDLSVDYFQQALSLCEHLKDVAGQSACIGRLGTVTYHKGHPRKAISNYQESLKMARKMRCEYTIATDLGNIGRAFFMLGSYEEALSYYRRSFRLARNLKIRKGTDKRKQKAIRRLKASIQGNLGDICLIRGQYKEAIFRYRKWLKVARKIGDYRLEGAALGGLGNAYQNFGDHRIGIQYHSQHLEISRKINDRMGESKALNNIGLSYNFLGQRQEAISYFEKSLKVKRECSNNLDEGSSLGNIGGLYFSLGRVKEAFNYFFEALEVADAAGNIHERLVALVNLGGAFIHGERYSEAIEFLEHSLVLSKSLGERLMEASINHSLGAAYANQGSYSQAFGYFQDALTIYQAIESQDGEATALHSLASIQYGRGEIKAAIRLAEQALAIRKEIGDYIHEIDTQCLLGRIYKSLSEYGKSIQIFQCALDNCYPDVMPFEALEVCRNLGDLWLEVRDLDAAIEAYEFAISTVEKCRQDAIIESDKQNILRKLDQVYSKMVETCIKNNQLEKAIETAERSRSKWLSDLIFRNNLIQEGEIPEEVKVCLSKYDSIQKEIDQIHRSISGHLNNTISFGDLENTRDVRSRTLIGVTDERIQVLEAQKRMVREELNTVDKITASLLEAKNITVESIQSLIDGASTAILSTYSTFENTYVFILRHNRTIDFHTCRGQGLKKLHSWLLEKWIYPYVHINKNSDEEECVSSRIRWQTEQPKVLKELADRLGLEALIEKLEGIHEVVLIPSFCLHQIPFSALPVKDGYFGDRFRIRSIPSSQILEFCQQRLDSKGKNETSVSYATVEDATEDLPCSNFEGELLSNLFKIPAERRLKGHRQATVENYRQLIRKVEGVISSHHAQSRLDDALESALVLADGRITLGQLLTPGWRLPKLRDVFLSCCETGLGSPSQTDDVLTLSAGFLCAGAISVVSTLWAVDDIAAALFSIRYHQHRQKLDRSTALQKAQQYIRDMSGAELAQQYKQPLITMLDQKFEVAEAKRRQAEEKRQQFCVDTQPYQKWQEKHDFWAEVAIRIDDTQTRLKALCREALPFSHPTYWAGFISQGLR